MRSVIGIDIAADAATVFHLARTVERWPDLLPHYVAVRPERRTETGVIARFVARRPIMSTLGIGLPVAWRALVSTDAVSRQLRFRHLGGATAEMAVTWTISDVVGGCRVSIVHDFNPRIRPWAALLDRLVVRPIAARTLASFKAIAEAVGETS
jgi:ribosome-associated toxin RatA of RatAB toxin-antitoxin module